MGWGWRECDTQWVNFVCKLSQQDTSMKSVGWTGWQPTLGISQIVQWYSKTQTLDLLPLKRFYSVHWLTNDSAVRKTVGFAHCWVHMSVGTISTSSKASIEPGLRAKPSQETLLSFLSEESLTARKDALMGTLHSQAKLPLESLPLLCQLIKP